ncbi:MAG: hypothetical protein IKC87_02775 [Clostridia bacterium]|nr:hypothetical protein [Clostridia bacterium]
MKTKIISLLLTLAMILSILASCGPTGTPPSEEKPPEEKPPIGDYPPGEGPGTGTAYTFDDAVVIAASKERLENADLSFDFSSADLSAKQASAKKLTVLDSTVTDGDGYTFTAHPDDLGVDVYNSGFFGNDLTLELLRKSARETADWFIENIYALDTVINVGAYDYLMSYDKKTGALSITQVTDYGTEIDYCNIKLSYSENGNEVIEMISANGTDLHKTVYIKDEYYSIESVGGLNSSGYYSKSLAYVENGYWRNVRISANDGFSLFNDSETYKDSNECLTVDVSMETERGIITLVSNLEPRRANGEKVCTWNTDIMADDDRKKPDDYYKYYTDALTAYPSQLISSYDQNFTPAITLSLDALEGWDAIVFSSPLSPEQTGAYYEGHLRYEYETNSYSSEITEAHIVVGGKSFPLRTVYTKTHGFMTKIGVYNGHEHYLLADGETVISHEQINSPEFVEIVPSIQFEEDDSGALTRITEVKLDFTFDYNSYYDRATGEFLFIPNKVADLEVKAIESYLSAIGILDEDEISYPRYLMNMFQSGNEISSNLFEKMTGYLPSAESYIAIYDAAKKECVNLYTSKLDEMENSYPNEEFNYEKLNAYKALGAAILEIDDAISGTASVSESGIDFSSLSVILKRNPILSSSKKYGTVITFAKGNPDAEFPVYSSVQFSGSDITFAGNSSLPIPETLTEGSYVLSAYFVRENEDTKTAISNVAPIPVSDFAEFTKEYDLTVNDRELTFIAKYSCQNSTLNLEIDIKDVDPPEMILNGAAYDESTNTYTYRFEHSKKRTVKDLLTDIDVFDRVDGSIVLTAENVTLDGKTVAAGKSLISGEVYNVTVSDARGNVAAANFLVDTYAADSSDKTPPVITVFEDLQYNALLDTYTFIFGERTAKSVLELFNLVQATDTSCGSIPLELENITVNGAPVDANDMLTNGTTYTLTFEDWNLNVATVKITVEIFPEN